MKYGMTVPFDQVPLNQQKEWFAELADIGYTDLWSAEAMGTDAFTPLVLASQWAPTLRLGTAIVPAFTRGPACLAQSVGSLAQVAPGRTVLGLGTSSDVIVERWNGIPFEKPFAEVRDMTRFLRQALTGEKVTMDAETLHVSGFRLGAVPPLPVPIMIAALRPGMLRLAGRVGDGAIINWLAASDVPTVVREVQAGALPDAAPKEIVARIFVAPDVDRDVVLAFGRMAIAAYLTVPVYAAFHEWLGRGEQLRPMWDHWAAGDRAAATAAIPESVVDALIVSGPAAQCREHIQEYVANGVTCPVLALLPFGNDQQQAYRSLAPH